MKSKILQLIGVGVGVGHTPDVNTLEDKSGQLL